MLEVMIIELATIFESYDDDLCIDLVDFIDALGGYLASSPDRTNPRIWFSFERGYYDSGDTAEVKIIRDETQQEAEAREAAENLEEEERRARAKQESERYELRQLAALKAKYEGKA